MTRPAVWCTEPVPRRSYVAWLALTGTVTPTGPYTPTGTVAFRSGTTTLGTIALSGGTASYTASSLTPGTKSITAVYNADNNNASSTSTVLSQMVNKAATTTTLTSAPNPSTFGQSVTFTATVMSASGTPTGSVTFRRGTTLIGTATLNLGVATVSTSTLPRGSVTVTATYNGTANYASSAGSVVQTVN